MKTSFLNIFLVAVCAISSLAHAQSLQPAWDYSYDEAAAGKQITSADIYSGSDGSVALVVYSDDGGGGSYESQILWLRANDTSPADLLWASGWIATTEFTTVVAVRRNHLVYSSGRELKSVTLDSSGTATVETVKTFGGAEEGGNLTFTSEFGARAPGFVYATAIHQDNLGFKFSAFRLTPAAPQRIEVAAYSYVSGNALSISFRSDLGVNYQLQSSATLGANTWVNVGDVIAGDGLIKTFSEPIVVPELFFRIVAL